MKRGAFSAAIQSHQNALARFSFAWTEPLSCEQRAFPYNLCREHSLGKRCNWANSFFSVSPFQKLGRVVVYFSTHGSYVLGPSPRCGIEWRSTSSTGARQDRGRNRPRVPHSPRRARGARENQHSNHEGHRGCFNGFLRRASSPRHVDRPPVRPGPGQNRTTLMEHRDQRFLRDEFDFGGG